MRPMAIQRRNQMKQLADPLPGAAYARFYDSWLGSISCMGSSR